MRDDLNKLLCERERHGHRNRFKPYRRMKAFSPAADEDGDNRLQREGISLRYGHSRLAPGTDIFTREVVVAGKYAARKRAASPVMLRNFGLV